MNHTPLRVLMGAGLAPWTMTLRSGLTGEVTLTGGEVRDLCLAIELDRVTSADVVALLTERRITGRPLEWCSELRRGRSDLMDGARGLRREDAPGELTVTAALARVGVEVLRWDMAAASPREALAKVREDARRGAA